MIGWKGFSVLAWLLVAAIGVAGVGMYLVAPESSALPNRSPNTWLFALGWAACGALLLWSIRRLPALVMFLAALAVCLNMGGWTWNLFTEIAWYDEVVHGYTTLALTLAFGVLIYQPLLANFAGLKGRFMLAILTLGLAIGAVWEMIEFVASQVMASYTMKGLTDTVTDLMCDGLGALLAAILSPWVAHATDAWTRSAGIGTGAQSDGQRVAPDGRTREGTANGK